MKKEFVKPKVELVEINTIICEGSPCPPVQGGGGEDGNCDEEG